VKKLGILRYLNKAQSSLLSPQTWLRVPRSSDFPLAALGRCQIPDSRERRTFLRFACFPFVAAAYFSGYASGSLSAQRTQATEQVQAYSPCLYVTYQSIPNPTIPLYANSHMLAAKKERNRAEFTAFTCRSS